MHAAYVLLLVHAGCTCEQHASTCVQEGTNWSCVHQDFLHMCRKKLANETAYHIDLQGNRDTLQIQIVLCPDPFRKRRGSSDKPKSLGLLQNMKATNEITKTKL